MDTRHSGLYASPTRRLTKTLLLGIISTIDSSENNIFSHCSSVQFSALYTTAVFFLCAFVRSGFLATQLFNPLSCSILLIVLEHTTVPVESANSLFSHLDVAFLLDRDRRFRRRSCRFDVTRGRPVLTLSFTVPVSPFSSVFPE